MSKKERDRKKEIEDLKKLARNTYGDDWEEEYHRLRKLRRKRRKLERRYK